VTNDDSRRSTGEALLHLTHGTAQAAANANPSNGTHAKMGWCNTSVVKTAAKMPNTNAFNVSALIRVL
jgi:hypothetical protein